MDKILAQHINNILFVINIVGGVTTILSIGMDIVSRLQAQQRIIQNAHTQTTVPQNAGANSTYTNLLFWASLVFFAVTGICLLFSSVDFYRVMSLVTFSMLFSIAVFLKLIQKSIEKATQRLESFIMEQSQASIKSQLEMQKAKMAIQMHQQQIDKTQKFVDDNKNNIDLSTTMARIYAYNNFT